MNFETLKEQLAELIETASWEQILFAMSQLAADEDSKESKDVKYRIVRYKYKKLSDKLHDLSNLMG